MRNIRILLAAANIFAAALMQAAECGAQVAPCRSDEYDLMSLLIREQYGSEFSLIVISGGTEPWCLRQQLGFLRKKWPELKTETIDSLIVANNGVSRRLDTRFDLPVEYRVISDAEYIAALRGDSAGPGLAASAGSAGTGLEAYAAVSGAFQPDWDGFDRAFPDAQGYLIFSRIGFDSECTQALVIFSNAYRCSGTRVRPRTRDIACFLKEDGEWRLAGVSHGVDAADR